MSLLITAVKIVILLLFLIFFLQFSVSAQVVNIENSRIYDDTSGWSGSVDVGFSIMDNKTRLYTLALKPKIQYKSKKHYYFLLSDFNYARGANEVFSNTGMLHFRYAYRLGKKEATEKSPWKWESYLQIQYNELLDQRMRTLAGTGMRLKVTDHKGLRVFSGVSSFYEYEEIQSTRQIIQDIRSSNYISCYVHINSVASLSAVTYYQPLWNNFQDYRFMGQYQLNFSVFKRTDFKVEFNTFYDSRPPSNVRNWVFNSLFGVRVKI